MPLLSSSIIWYRPKGDDALLLLAGIGKVAVNLVQSRAYPWPI